MSALGKNICYCQEALGSVLVAKRTTFLVDGYIRYPAEPASASLEITAYSLTHYRPSRLLIFHQGGVQPAYESTP